MEVLEKRMTAYEFLELELPDDASFTYELLNGLLVRKNAPSGEHQFAQSEIFGRIFMHLTATQAGRVFGSPTAVILSELNVPQPDLCVLLQENMEKFDPEWGIRGAPDLVVEIVSPSSYKNDRFDKKLLYETSGVREYWLVDPAYRSVEVFVLKDEKYQTYSFGVEDETIKSEILSGFELNLTGIFTK